MTILKRAWKATEVDREGFRGLFDGLGGFLSSFGIIVLPVFILACIVFAILSLFR